LNCALKRYETIKEIIGIKITKKTSEAKIILCFVVRESSINSTILNIRV
jgi:hypothetical protein